MIAAVPVVGRQHGGRRRPRLRPAGRGPRERAPRVGRPGRDRPGRDPGRARLAWLLARSLARPVRSSTAPPCGLGAGDLDARATPEGPEEIASLATSFNRMAAALGSTVRVAARLRRERVASAADAAHGPAAAARGRPGGGRPGRRRGRQGAGRGRPAVGAGGGPARLQSAASAGATGRADGPGRRRAGTRSIAGSREAGRSGMTLRAEAPPPSSPRRRPPTSRRCSTT